MSQWRPGIFLFLIICNFHFLVGTMLSKLWEPIQQTRGDRRIRGGVRQQLAALEADEAIEGDPIPEHAAAASSSSSSRPTISKLASGHLLDYCDGMLSAARMQHHMANAVADGMRHPMVQRLGNLPSANNAQRGVKQLLDGIGIFEMQTELEGTGLVSRIMGRWKGGGRGKE